MIFLFINVYSFRRLYINYYEFIGLRKKNSPKQSPYMIDIFIALNASKSYQGRVKLSGAVQNCHHFHKYTMSTVLFSPTPSSLSKTTARQKMMIPKSIAGGIIIFPLKKTRLYRLCSPWTPLSLKVHFYAHEYDDKYGWPLRWKNYRSNCCKYEHAK